MKFKDCEITAGDGRISISNSMISRKWVIENGLCHAVSLSVGGREYLKSKSESAAPSPDFPINEKCRKVSYKIYKSRECVVEEESLRLDIKSVFAGHGSAFTGW